MLHQVFTFFVLFFHGLFLTLTIIMKCTKILFVHLTSDPEAFIVALLHLGISFFPPILEAFISAERNNVLL